MFQEEELKEVQTQLMPHSYMHAYTVYHKFIVRSREREKFQTLNDCNLSHVCVNASFLENTYQKS